MFTEIKNLKHFYQLMFQTRDARKHIVAQYLHNKPICSTLVSPLTTTLNSLKHLPQENNRHILPLDNDQTISVDLSYEINELEKDLFFLEHDEDSFFEYLSHRHPDFMLEVNSALKTIQKFPVRTLITDRDGTINNYCGRYASSIQSIYNAVYLSQYAQTIEQSIILTSAPLSNIGLADISTCIDGTFIYAGSKGREYYDSNGKRHVFEIDPNQQAKLLELNYHLNEFLKKSGYEKFRYIGSGLQMKFGQTTIAHQDFSLSISEEESQLFSKAIQNIVKSTDPENKYFHIENTSKDLEIILTVGDGESIHDFNKGDGIRFLNADLNLNLHLGGNLICGDTPADIAMIPASAEFSPETHAIFVTTDESLKEKTRSVCPNALFVSSPDVLVSLFHKLAQINQEL